MTALGVVFGDIGTSPLYALRECFAGAHAIPVTASSVLGVVSLIVWSLVVTVSIKYLLFVMRADNQGEGGILALVALVRARAGGAHGALVATGLFGAALLYGDGMITPAISVLSAVEGLGVATSVFDAWLVPLTVVVLVALFLVQGYGTEQVGRLFGPVMIAWFVVIAALGAAALAREPQVLAALSPVHAVRFCRAHGLATFLTLGAVFLSVTGAEALYADMGHFGRHPIRVSWFAIVLPALLLNYLGQGAQLIADPAARMHPFYHLAPGWALYPVVVLATLATVIASQAVISGSFSLTRQAIQLGYAPRFDVHHTSADAPGQIYVPEINWLLMLSTVGLVLGFRTSTNLAAAYGMAVTTTMVITTVLAYVVARERWEWTPWQAGAVAAVFLAVDLAFFFANVIKIEHGGWFPLVVAALVFAVMTTWRTGRQAVAARLRGTEEPTDRFLAGLAAHPPLRVPGTGVFMTNRPEGVPPILVHHLRHNKVLPERVVLLTVTTADVPTVAPDQAVDVQEVGDGLFRVVARFGFMQAPDVPGAIERARGLGLDTTGDVTYYLAHLTLFVPRGVGMPAWRDRLFVFLSRNARRATNYFCIPPDRVVEIGMQLTL